MANINFHILSLFPDTFDGFINSSMIDRAINNNLITIKIVDIRAYTEDKHSITDDYQFGGGSGMVMKPEPICNAVDDILKTCANPKDVPVILMTPQGKTFNQTISHSFSSNEDIIIICGHYTGVDERVIDLVVTHQLSVGDFITTGGEIPAMLVIDCISRFVPGVIGSSLNVSSDSITSGLLEHPLYTRPRIFRGMNVPEVLIKGDHKKIEQWRRTQSIIKTFFNRPDLLESAELDERDRRTIDELQEE